MLKISNKVTGEKDTDINTEFSLTTLNDNLFCAKNQSKQRDTPKINCSKSNCSNSLLNNYIDVRD